MRKKPQQKIDGKPIKKLVDLPCGAFKRLVQATVDPYWGAGLSEEEIEEMERPEKEAFEQF